MQRNLSQWILIIGLAYVFAFFGIDKIVRPLLWIQWIPLSFEGLLGLSRNVWLSIFGVIEILLAILLLIPQRMLQKTAAVLMALHLVAVITQTGPLSDIGVRDSGLFLMALGLAFSL